MKPTAEFNAAARAAGCAGEWFRGINHHGLFNDGIVAITGFYRTATEFCAVTVKQGQYYGRLTRMELWLNNHYDRGDFLYQAGPVRAPRGRCYNLSVAMWNGHRTQIVQLDVMRYLGAC